MGSLFDYTAGFVSGLVVAYASWNTIPSTDDVNKDYVSPSRLEVEVSDLDFDGSKETIVKIDDKPYLLKEKDGVPSLIPYTVEPAKIILKDDYLKSRKGSNNE